MATALHSAIRNIGFFFLKIALKTNTGSTTLPMISHDQNLTFALLQFSTMLSRCLITSYLCKMLYRNISYDGVYLDSTKDYARKGRLKKCWRSSRVVMKQYGSDK